MLFRPMSNTNSTFGRLRAAGVLDGVLILGALAALLLIIATLGALGFGVAALDEGVGMACNPGSRGCRSGNRTDPGAGGAILVA